MKIFFPIVHPIFRFPSLHHSEKRSIKFVKNKKLGDKANEKDKQTVERTQPRLAEHSFGGIDPQVAWWFFYHRK